MIEIPFVEFFDLINKKECIDAINFIDAIKLLKNDGKIDVRTSFSNSSNKVRFIFADEKEELVFKLKYGNLIPQ